MQKRITTFTKDVRTATFSSDRWIVRIIMALGAGFAALQANGNNWPGYIPATDTDPGYWLDPAIVSYRAAALVMVVLLAWVNWKPNGK
jgi:hypothetical protein